MKKYNVEVNWFGAHNSNGWQVINDEPIEAMSEEEALEQMDPDYLEGCLSVLTVDEDGYDVVKRVDGAECRAVEIEEA